MWLMTFSVPETGVSSGIKRQGENALETIIFLCTGTDDTQSPVLKSPRLLSRPFCRKLRSIILAIKGVLLAR